MWPWPFIGGTIDMGFRSLAGTGGCCGSPAAGNYWSVDDAGRRESVVLSLVFTCQSMGCSVWQTWLADVDSGASANANCFWLDCCGLDPWNRRHTSKNST